MNDPTTGLPIGRPVDPPSARRPQRCMIEGRYVTVAPLDPSAHADALWEYSAGTENDRLWTYLFHGPFQDRAAFDADLAAKAASQDPLFFSILDNASRSATGYAAFLRIEPAHRCIEVGSTLYTPVLQRTRGATEAMYLMARHVFEDLGYRRYEWKCDALNAPSRRAAVRLGFLFEGIFRQHMVGATEIQPGTQCSTRSGRRARPRSSAGSIPRTSIPVVDKEHRCLH